MISLVGVVWILQGTNLLHGSGMSGHGEWALLGAIALAGGVALFVWAARIRSQTPSGADANEDADAPDSPLN